MKSARHRKTAKKKIAVLVKAHIRANGTFVKEHWRILPVRKNPGQSQKSLFDPKIDAIKFGNIIF